MSYVGTAELYATGLGLMLYSPGGVDALVDGEDYEPSGESFLAPVPGLMGSGDVVLLSTGSPQLDYTIHIHLGDPEQSIVSRSHSQVEFGIRIQGADLCLRDGYDLMEWERDAEHVKRVPLPDGVYGVTAVWIPCSEHGRMLIHMFFDREQRAPLGARLVNLDFVTGLPSRAYEAGDVPEPLPNPLGEVVPDLAWDKYFWTGTCLLTTWAGFQERQGAYGSRSSSKPSTGRVRLSVAGSEGTPPGNPQAAAFRHLLENEASVTAAVVEAVFNHYPRIREIFEDAYEEKDFQELVPEVKSHDDLKTLIGLATVHILEVELGSCAYLGFQFGCTWDDEHGLGVMTHLGRVVEVGQASDSFTWWVADRDREAQA